MAKPLVTCRETPKNMEKMKKIAIFLCLKSLNACKPNMSATEVTLPSLLLLQTSSVKAYKPNTSPMQPLITN